MKEWTKEAILLDAEDKDVRFIRLMFTDILGVVKNVEVPLSQLEKALNGNMAFDGSSIEGFTRIEESDMYLVPDYNTWLVFQWHENDLGRVARLICNVETPDRKPFAGDPRGNLQVVLEKMHKLGFSAFNLGSEPEFYLFKTDDKGNPTLSPNDQGGYFDLAPSDLAEKCRREIVIELEDLGFEIEASHHEVGPGQHEIDWKYDAALQACDHIQTFKLIVKTVARRHGLHATFMPKPIYGIAGSGMHCNLSLFKEDGNAFYDPNDSRLLSQTAYYFMGGLLKHAPAYTAICNPTINSYKRLVAGFEAPVYIAWSQQNRSPLIRIPAARGNSTRLEVRSVDPSANPYLAMAVLLCAGLDGIEKQMDPGAPIDANIYEMNLEEREAAGIYDLPQSLAQALENFAHDKLMKEALGSHIHDSFIMEKEYEIAEYNKQITPWEIENYLQLY